MAGFNLGDIFTTVKAKTEGLKEALGGVKDLADEAKQGSAKVNTFAQSFQSFAKKTGAVLIGVGVGLTAYAKSATDFTVEYVKNSKTLAREIGSSVQEASRLTYAFSRMGLSGQDASTSLGILSKKINESSTNSEANKIAMQGLQIQIEKTRREITATSDEIKKNGDKSGELGLKLRGLQNDLAALEDKAQKSGNALDQLGISTKNAEGNQKGFKEILFEVADKFKEMPDGATKTAMAMDLFGRSGKDMIKVLNLGSEGIANLEKQADKLGITLTDKTVAGVAKLVESQKKMKENADAIKIAVGTLTTPVLASFNEWIAKLLGKFQTLNPEMKAAAANILAFGGPVATGSGAVLEWVGNLGAAKDAVGGFNLKALAGIPIIGNLAGAFSSLGAFLGNPYVLAIIAIVAAAGFLLDKFGLLKPMIDATKEAIVGIWNTMMTALKPAFDSIKTSMEQLSPLWPPLMTALKFIAYVIGVIVVGSVVTLVAVLAGLTAAVAYVVAGVLAFFVRLKDETIGKFNEIRNIINLVMIFISAIIAAKVSEIMNRWQQLAALPGRIGSWIGAIPGIVSNALGAASRAIGGWIGNFMNSGRALIDAFANGISQRIGRVKDIVAGGLAAVRRLLPFSDAKEGPLSDLTLSGRRLMTTIADGVGKGEGSLYKQVSDSFEGLPTAVLNSEYSNGRPTLAQQIAQQNANQTNMQGPSQGGMIRQENHYHGDFKIDSKETADYVFKKMSNDQELAAKGVATQAGALGA
jgi:hypothetical protein